MFAVVHVQQASRYRSHKLYPGTHKSTSVRISELSPHGVCVFQPPCGMYIREESVKAEQLAFMLAYSGRACTTVLELEE